MQHNTRLLLLDPESRAYYSEALRDINKLRKINKQVFSEVIDQTATITAYSRVTIFACLTGHQFNRLIIDTIIGRVRIVFGNKAISALNPEQKVFSSEEEKHLHQLMVRLSTNAEEIKELHRKLAIAILQYDHSSQDYSLYFARNAYLFSDSQHERFNEWSFRQDGEYPAP